LIEVKNTAHLQAVPRQFLGMRMFIIEEAIMTVKKIEVEQTIK
jgi:hypothetical protein